jgi:DNA-directed RNA polymerase specialized sigma24 family protein
MEEIFTSKELINYCKKIAGQLGEDLFQELCIIVLSNPDNKPSIQYCKRIALYQYVNKYSQFNKTFRQDKVCPHTLEAVLEQSDDKWMDVLEDCLTEQPKDKREMFTKEVFIEFTKCGSIRKLEQETGISRMTLLHAKKRFVDSVKQKIKNKTP